MTCLVLASGGSTCWREVVDISQGGSLLHADSRLARASVSVSTPISRGMLVFRAEIEPKVFGKFVVGSRVRRKRFGKGPDWPSIATFDLPTRRYIYVMAITLTRCCASRFLPPFFIAAISKKLSRRLIFRLRNWYSTCSIHGCTEPAQSSSLGGYKRS